VWRRTAHLESGEEELSWRQLQEPHSRISHWGLQEQHQLLAEGKAAANGNSSSKQRHQHALTQLL
jgi:hypothetical protein